MPQNRFVGLGTYANEGNTNKQRTHTISYTRRNDYLDVAGAIKALIPKLEATGTQPVASA